MVTHNRVDDLCSAALRHVRDARWLLDEPARSPDQAWHLAGFGPECARKACVENSAVHKIIGHDVHDAELTDWAAAIEPRFPRVALVPAPTGDWRPDHRYERTGARLVQQVAPFVAACESDAYNIVGHLWCTGEYSGGREST